MQLIVIKSLIVAQPYIKKISSAKLLVKSSHGPDVRGLWSINDPRARGLKPLIQTLEFVVS